MPKLGPYSKEIVLARPDGRTKQGRLLQQMRSELIRLLPGGQANAAQRALVERCAMLQLRISALDQRIVEGDFTEYDSKVYLAFSNSLGRTLARLGVLDPAVAQPVDPMAALRAHLAARHGEAA